MAGGGQDVRDLPRREREEETDDPHSEGHGGHLRVVGVGDGRAHFGVWAVFFFDGVEVEGHSGFLWGEFFGRREEIATTTTTTTKMIMIDNKKIT